MSAHDGKACTQCEALMINGVYCHEYGCPEAWKDREIPCFECGCNYQPEVRYQTVCSDCAAMERFA